MSANIQRSFKIMVAIDGSETSMRKPAEYAIAMTKNANNKDVLLIGITIIDLGRLNYSFFRHRTFLWLKGIRREKTRSQEMVE